MKLCTFLVATFALAAAASAQGPQPSMERAHALTQQAYNVLKNGTTADKGGHRRAAMDKLQVALEEIQRGINYDNRNRGTANEGSKR